MYFKQKTLFWGQLFLIILKFFQNTNAFLLFNSHLKDQFILKYVTEEKWKDSLKK